MIRIGSFAAQNLTLSQNMETQARMQEHRIQISTGKKAQAYDGISADTRRLEGLETKHQQISSFTKSIKRTDQRMAEMENVVSQLQDIASDFRSKLLQAGSGENLAATNIQGEAETLLQEAASLLNSEFEGRFLFGGSRTDQAPVVLQDNAGNDLQFDDGTPDDIESGAYYRGNDQVLSARVDTDLSVDYGVTADSANESGFHDLISALARVARPNVALEQEVENATDNLSDPNNGAIKRLADTRADIGSTRDVVERTKQRLEDTRLNVEEGITDIENVDVARAMTELSGHQTTLQASYAVTARVSNLSLLNFLR